MKINWKKTLKHDNYYYSAKAIVGFMIGFMWFLTVTCLVVGVAICVLFPAFMIWGISLSVSAILCALITIIETVFSNLILSACYDIKMIRDNLFSVPDSKFSSCIYDEKHK